jgi:hypothetical protein
MKRRSFMLGAARTAAAVGTYVAVRAGTVRSQRPLPEPAQQDAAMTGTPEVSSTVTVLGAIRGMLASAVEKR